MPNWCDTHIRLVGPEEELKKIDEIIRDAFNAKGDKYSVEKSWIGQPLIYTGIFKDKEAVCNSGMSTRGWFESIEYDGGEEMNIYQEDAWAPNLGPVAKLCEVFAKNVTMYFTAIEPGCEIYCSNDPECAGKWIFDIFGDPPNLPESFKECDRDFIDEDRARAILAEAFGENLKDLDIADTELLADNAVEMCDYEVQIHRIDPVDIGDFS